MKVYICDMQANNLTPKQALTKRHQEAIKNLKEISDKKMKGKVASVVCAMVGTPLEITGQTVHNYVKGKCNDGFLTEAIAKEFKKLKA